MRLASVGGRATIVSDEGLGVDVADVSDGRFGPGFESLFDRWKEFRAWYDDESLVGTPKTLVAEDLSHPLGTPKQVFAIGLNYRDHAQESGLTLPSEPPVFTKFVSSLAAPVSQVDLPDGSVDWEAELAVVIGLGGHHIARSEAWSHVAGVCVAQDLSERRLQLAGPVPQFSLAKSYPGFMPVGPHLVTIDDLDNPDDLEIGCSLNGEEVQKSRTSEMVFPVPVLIEKLSAVTPLYPGDLILTGTPAGVGAARTPARALSPGDELSTYVEGIGEIRQSFVAGSSSNRKE